MLRFYCSILIDIVRVYDIMNSVLIIVIAIIILHFILEILCNAFYIMLMIAFSYQALCIYVLFGVLCIGNERDQSLQLEDPDSKFMRDLFSSMVHIIPGMNLFIKKTSANTKSA